MVAAMEKAQMMKGEQRERELAVEMKVKTSGENSLKGEQQAEENCSDYTMDGSVDFRGRPASKGKTGGWLAGSLLLVNQGLATLAFFGVGVNLVMFLTRVLQQNNADAANDVSKWTGTVYIFSLIGAFLSDSYWGRYKTCAIFQAIFVLGLGLLSLSSYLFLLKPSGCGDKNKPCGPHSGVEVGVFYLSIYMVALGYGGYQPNIATFGADQFDEEDPKEAKAKVAFFSYFYLALNLGSLFSNTLLVYFEDKAIWTLGFWASTGSISAALALFLGATCRYRHFRPGGNPLSRVCQVVMAASRKWKVRMRPGGNDLYEDDGKGLAAAGPRKLLHTKGFKFLDRAALVDSDNEQAVRESASLRDPWRLCTVTQVEEVKCVLRLLPIWLCTIIYSVVFTQMASLFVEQGGVMNTSVAGFHLPPASMSAFDILSVAAFILLYRRALRPLASRLRKDPKGLTELQRMGAGLVIAMLAMLAAGSVEVYRLRHVCRECGGESASSLSILFQVPQYVLVGASEVFMYVGQLEFFNGQTPDGLKSFASALCMASMSLGNYVSSLLVTVVMKLTAGGGRPGWIPSDLNDGHLDRFFFLLAVLTSADFVLYLACARSYKSIQLESRFGDNDEDSSV